MAQTEVLRLSTGRWSLTGKKVFTGGDDPVTYIVSLVFLGPESKISFK
jgi:hypothetical protein